MSGRGRGRGRGRGSNSGVAPTDVGSGVVSTAHGAGQPTPDPPSSSIGRSAKRRRTDDVSNYADADADVDQQQQHNMGGVSFNPPNPNMKIDEKAESQKKSKMEALRASVMEEDIEKARPMETEEEKKAKTMNDEDLTDEEKVRGWEDERPARSEATSINILN
ncbi:hypothetical protein TL16_g02050 [Triparma laevis f. inornata]|uniref:Uncharacterized protein n=1 Tax=Triparma laevis f. inornata TaxID=1714386 RepID=A0A9W6ZT21_9STRA|nr:hypothetical protein TL16_g02050 [Triparma laevis f. inornata]